MHVCMCVLLLLTYNTPSPLGGILKTLDPRSGVALALGPPDGADPSVSTLDSVGWVQTKISRTKKRLSKIMLENTPISICWDYWYVYLGLHIFLSRILVFIKHI